MEYTELRELTARLCAVPGPSGSEGDVREMLRGLLLPLADEVTEDVMGNLLAVKRCGRENAPRLLLDAHLDEVGLIVTGYDKGFLCFGSLGGIDPRMLPAREVEVLCDPPLRGVIDTLPPHILKAADMDKTMERDKLRIDVGLSEESVRERVPLGTPAVFISDCIALGKNRLCSRALDDRACAAILLRVLQCLQDKELKVDLYLQFASQEELGTRGAITGTFSARPDEALVVDVTHGRTPDAKKEETLPLGGGAAIGLGPNMTRRMSDRLLALAKEREIPHQVEVLRGNSGTDAWAIQVSRAGVATALISLPLRYMHTPVETMDLRDADAVVRLLCAYVESFGKEDAADA